MDQTDPTTATPVSGRRALPTNDRLTAAASRVRGCASPLSGLERAMRAAQDSAQALIDWAASVGYVVRLDFANTGRLLTVEASDYLASEHERVDEHGVRRHAEAVARLLERSHARCRDAHARQARAIRRRDPCATIWPWQVSRHAEMATQLGDLRPPVSTAGGTRARGAGRPRARRTSSSSRTSGADPGDEGPGEPPPPRLGLAPPPRAILTYGLLTAEQRGAVEEVVA